MVSDQHCPACMDVLAGALVVLGHEQCTQDPAVPAAKPEQGLELRQLTAYSLYAGVQWASATSTSRSGPRRVQSAASGGLWTAVTGKVCAAEALCCASLQNMASECLCLLDAFWAASSPAICGIRFLC